MKPERYKQIEELYHSVLGRKPEERAAFLEQSCRVDEALRREVESLLGYDERAKQFIETPPDDLAVAMLAAEQKKSMVGRTLGHYRVESILGSGGMGEVYRATDTRLDRTVAVKVLPQHLASNPERRQRFEREARAVSSLSHPHICALYDVGQQDGIDYLVMEYIEGESLADRLAKGPLPVDQALRYAIQVADALDKAHRAGITHRDLKPANVMLAKSGAKLLDFGLAKLRSSDTEAVFTGQSNVPTEQLSLTADGTIVGTFQYMAPEQLEAGPLDARTDIFSFGALLYEMITGKRAFDGKSQASLIGAILRAEPPPVSTIQPMTPPGLDRVVQRCLAKDPDERWQSAGDLMLELKWIAGSGSEAGTTSSVAARGRSRERLAWIVAAALLGLVAMLLFIVGNIRRAPTEVGATRFVIPVSGKQSLLYPSISPDALLLYPSISRDGRNLVYPDSKEGRQQLWIRKLDSVTPQPLPGTEKTSYPAFWSPDGRFIGFFADGKLKKMQLSGGPPQSLADVPNPRGGSWNQEGVIIFAPDGTSPLYRMSANGGERIQLTTLDESRKEISHRWPLFLPDGRHFLYVARSPQRENSAIYVGSLDSKETKRLLSADSSVAYAPQGYLVLAREGTLMAQPFDVDTLSVTGAEFSVVEQVSYAPSGLAGFSVSENGVLAYMTGNPATQLAWFDRSGTQVGTLGQPAAYLSLRISPDEKRVAVARNDPPALATDISLIELARGVASRLTSDPSIDDFPVWSPDGTQIVFSSGRDGAMNLYTKLSSGAGKEEALLRSNQAEHMQDWSPDGRFLLYRTFGLRTKSDIWVLPTFGDKKPYPFLATESDEAFARFSPDGRWVAYASDDVGTSEVYVREFQGSGGSLRVSTGGGSFPCWRRDGKELFYFSGGKLMAVDVKARATSFEPGVPKLLFEKSGTWNYDVSRDGQRILIAVPVEKSSPEPITVVLNWAADLKR